MLLGFLEQVCLQIFRDQSENFDIVLLPTVGKDTELRRMWDECGDRAFNLSGHFLWFGVSKCGEINNRNGTSLSDDKHKTVSDEQADNFVLLFFQFELNGAD
ncbi:hypothetical protein WICPIJ_002197 [Wickerhamomyces pijperi]|uniref:Uncharacterized protein n=1 Tax=Wickerhamomyces pijperi TaxID=599730 RepID=A0A9P8QC78_WICPI|nr:hypothetical protein WICPIJ_002197 [Wickerhamomyces pijperi]